MTWSFEEFMGKVLGGTSPLPDPVNRKPPPAPEVDHRPPELKAVQDRFGRNQRVGTSSNWQEVNGPEPYINTHELLRSPPATQEVHGPTQWRRALLIATIGVALTSAALIFGIAILNH